MQYIPLAVEIAYYYSCDNLGEAWKMKWNEPDGQSEITVPLASI